MEFGPMPGDPTPEEIAERCAEVHEFRRLGVLVPEVTNKGGRGGNRRADRRKSHRRHRRSHRESVVDLLLEGFTIEQVARMAKTTTDEIEDYANEIEMLTDNVAEYHCEGCQHAVTTNPCVFCILSAMRVASYPYMG